MSTEQLWHAVQEAMLWTWLWFVVKPKMLPEDKAFVQGSVCTLIGILRASLVGPLVFRAPGQQGADSVGHEDSENFDALSPGFALIVPCEPSICEQ